ncbi:MAG: hypothetical protein LBE31_01135, partial [Deltaproteobacteria bacterium]|nr:hypothetical protein [Deltaproteobacteria bacterium]
MTSELLSTRLSSLTDLINQTLRRVFEEDQGFFGEIGIYSLLGGGKRLRPIIFGLSYGALGWELGEESLKLASSFELLHMATL